MICPTTIRNLYNHFYTELVKLRYALDDEKNDQKRQFILGKLEAVEDVVNKLHKLL